MKVLVVEDQAAVAQALCVLPRLNGIPCASVAAPEAARAARARPHGLDVAGHRGPDDEGRSQRLPGQALGRPAAPGRGARAAEGGRGPARRRLLSELGAGSTRELQDALAAPADTLFTVGAEGDEETYRTVPRPFQINMRPHVLHLIERLTPELRRREVEVWKQAIRVMNHELNNSLAPIRSLAHSARQAAARPEHSAMLEPILATIEERATHLAGFLEGYARFARLPRPRPEAVSWSEFLDGVHALVPFRLEGEPPAERAWFAPAQMQQA